MFTPYRYNDIFQWSLEAFENGEQRSLVQKVCQEQARVILGRYDFVLDELAAVLLVEGCLSGAEVHSLIRQALNETGPDWRLSACGVK